MSCSPTWKDYAEGWSLAGPAHDTAPLMAWNIRHPSTSQAQADGIAARDMRDWRERRDGQDGLIWFVVFIWLVSFNQTNQTDQINKRNNPFLALHTSRMTCDEGLFGRS